MSPRIQIVCSNLNSHELDKIDFRHILSRETLRKLEEIKKKFEKEVEKVEEFKNNL